MTATLGLSGVKYVDLEARGKEKDMATKAVATFACGGEQYAVRLESGGSPKEVHALLERTPTGDGPGAAVTGFVRQCGEGAKVRLVPASHHPTGRHAIRYDFFYEASGLTRISVTDGSGRLLLGDGNLRDFREFAERYEAPHDLDGKVIKFYYEGGTGPGHRLVKVTSVQRTGPDRMLIRGKDVHKEDHRAYSTDKIRGDILVVA